MRIIIKFALISICFFSAAKVMAQKNDKREVEFGLELTSELQATNKGDYNNTNLLRLDASLPIGRNVSIEAASISTYMTASESIGDDLQTFSNLDAGNIPFALSVCGVSWTYTSLPRESRRGASHSLFMGIRNMNEDYFCSDVTSFFTNSSCGVYPTISANYPIANYPVASMGIHYCYDGGPIKVQASLYNGTGYNRFTGRNNVFRFCPKDDGVFGMAEVSYNRGGGYYCIGNALHCNERLSATPWFYTEQHICNTLSLLVGYSHAFDATGECKDFIGIGAHYQQKKCELGMFTDYACFVNAKEFATEITLKYNATDNLYVQPIFHLISTSFEASACIVSVHTIGSLRIGVSF